MTERIKTIRRIITENKLDGLFVTDQTNVRYFTKFEGLSPNEREAFLLITGKNLYLLTFPTYYEMLKNNAAGFRVLNITYKKRLHEHLEEIFVNENLKIIGFEKENVTVSELESLRNKLEIKLVPTERIVAKTRLIKDREEIQFISQASKITDTAYDFIKSKIKSGVSEKDLALEIEFFIKKNADDIAFSPIVAFNENAAIPHYLPNQNVKLIENSLILLDLGAKTGGYCSDMTRLIFFHTPPQKIINAYNAVREAQTKALESIGNNSQASDVDKISRTILKDAGYPEFLHGLGHGVGLSVHEDPRLRIGSNALLKENMVFTIEPGIYIPGQYGIRIEDLVVLRNGGPEILTKTTKDIVIL